MSFHDWDEVIDTFAARLDDQRSAMETSEVDSVPPFAPPPSIGPMPPRLHSRAEALLQEAAELQAEMAARLATTTREVQAVRRFITATVPPSRSVYLDGAL